MAEIHKTQQGRGEQGALIPHFSDPKYVSNHNEI